MSKTIVIVEIGKDTTDLDNAVTALSNVIVHYQLSVMEMLVWQASYVDNWDENKVKGVLTINAPYHGIGPYNSTTEKHLTPCRLFIAVRWVSIGPKAGQRKLNWMENMIRAIRFITSIQASGISLK